MASTPFAGTPLPKAKSLATRFCAMVLPRLADKQQPLRADLFALLHAFAAEHEHAIIQHRIGVALFSGTADELGGLDGVLLHALAFEIEHAEIILRPGMALGRRLGEPFDGDR